MTARQMIRYVDPACWPPKSGPVAAILWLGYVGACLAEPILTWTALPIAGAIAWRRAGHGITAIFSWVVPLAAILALLEASQWVFPSRLADAVWTGGVIAAAGVTALMVFDHGVQLRWLMIVPNLSPGQPWMVRLEVRRFEQASLAANMVVTEAHAGARRDHLLRRAQRLRSRAERYAQASRTWRVAWMAHIEWLAALEEAFASPDPAGSLISAIQEKHASLHAAIEAAAAETRAIDPLGVSVEIP